MIIVLKPKCDENDIKKVTDKIEGYGLEPHVSTGHETTIIGVIGDTTKVDPRDIEVSPNVEKVMRVEQPYKLANRVFHPEDTIVDVDGVKVGGGHIALIAGPCSVESEEQVIAIRRK